MCEARRSDDDARVSLSGIKSDHCSTLLSVSSNEIDVEEIICDRSVVVRSASVD
jgi:hypothetical protein